MKKLKLSKLDWETEFRFKGNKKKHQFNIKLVKKLKMISFLVTDGSISVKRR